jgi:hypothetical protein
MGAVRRRSSPPTTCRASAGAATRSHPATAGDRCHVGAVVARNEHLHVEVDVDGTYAVTTSDGLTVRGSDGSWTAATAATRTTTPARRDLLVDHPASVDVSTLESGPCARVSIDDVPVATHALGDERFCSRARTRPRRSRCTTLELRTGERFLRVHTELDNPCRDHRLRAHFRCRRR